LDAQVALKLLARPNISGDLYRFKQEFRALSDLSHPHLVSLYELLLERGHWFIVMELVEGSDFISHISTSAVRGQEPAVDRDQHASEPTLAPLAGQTQSATIASPGASVVTPFDLLRLELSLSQLARALCYLHSADRLHRDIKPSNVLVTTDGRIKVLDFGLVIELTPEIPDETLSILGTPAYMSPEHMCSQPLTQASDWYSVGVLL
jgi:serine/threonine protein kinase